LINTIVFARVWNVMVLGFSIAAAHECSAACGAVPDGVFHSLVYTVWNVLEVYSVVLGRVPCRGDA
jgi:hypothetical protein